MDRLVELATEHHYVRNGMRINTDLRPENRVQDRSGRTWLRRGPYSNTLRDPDHPVVKHVQEFSLGYARLP